MEDRSPKRFGLAAMALTVLATPIFTTGALAGQRSGSAPDNNMLPGKLGQQGTSGKNVGRKVDDAHVGTAKGSKPGKKVLSPAGGTSTSGGK